MAVGVRRQRVIISEIRPVVDCGRHPAKAAVGLAVAVEARIFADGHDLLLAWVRHGRPGRGGAATSWQESPLAPTGNDLWAAPITANRMGSWGFEISAVVDAYGSWFHELQIKHAAGQDVTLDLEEGALLVAGRLSSRRLSPADRRTLIALRSALASGEAGARVQIAGRPTSIAAMRRSADRSLATVEGPFPLWVDRERAAFSAWYELFPRSEGSREGRSGTLADAARRLPAIAGMGFDVVYLPPIHPIGITNRRGANNTPGGGPDDPGSPWAIGGSDGGHTAVNADLGTIEDFDRFVASARDVGLEVALDYALQCSPDHPWVREHPEWFRHRPDGSIRYAENPPKTYQDIYPLVFDSEAAPKMWAAMLEVLLFWIRHDVRIFRVDNPHTKSLNFWEWLITEVRRRHPEVIFLAEAFTRPAIMHHLAKLGFTQSYTYFTWRNTKTELAEYLTELARSPSVDYFRPNFWPNTPDILHETLQRGGPNAFRLRLVLAALCSSSWGMYSGFELFEHEAVRPGSEEYLDSEKYQLRPRDWDQESTLVSLIRRINEIRRAHRGAVAQFRTLRVHDTSDDALLCVSRSSDDRDDTLLVIVNLDPHRSRQGYTDLDLRALGISPDVAFTAHDLLTDATYTWCGPANFVRLDPHTRIPAHILHLRTP